MGFDKSTISRAIDTVSNALIAKNDRFIKWSFKEDILKSKQKFFSRSEFPGYIDGTQVRMQASFEDEAVFVNRKGFHSINVQTICDHESTNYNIVYDKLYFGHPRFKLSWKKTTALSKTATSLVTVGSLVLGF